MDIPGEVIEAAAKAQFEWQDGLPSWENDADGFTKAEYVNQTWAAAQVVAEWARKEAWAQAAEQVREYWDACGELIDSNNGARLAFQAVAAHIAEGDNTNE